MVTELPVFRGYTVDERLREFRKVTAERLTIEFIAFESLKGRRRAYQESLEPEFFGAVPRE